MSDLFEKKIKELASELDQHHPPQGHRNRMRQRLEEEKNPVFLKITKRQFWSVAAAMALVLSTTWWILDKGNSVVEERSELSLSELGQEMAQVEGFYLQTISDKKELIHASTDDALMVASFFKELDKLENEYNLLKKELAKYPSNEKIIDSMIMNYRSRIKILESLLDRLEGRKEKL